MINILQKILNIELHIEKWTIHLEYDYTLQPIFQPTSLLSVYRPFNIKLVGLSLKKNKNKLVGLKVLMTSNMIS